MENGGERGSPRGCQVLYWALNKEFKFAQVIKMQEIGDSALFLKTKVDIRGEASMVQQRLISIWNNSRMNNCVTLPSLPIKLYSLFCLATGKPFCVSSVLLLLRIVGSGCC